VSKGPSQFPDLPTWIEAMGRATDLDAIDIADTFWLARHLPVGETGAPSAEVPAEVPAPAPAVKTPGEAPPPPLSPKPAEPRDEPQPPFQHLFPRSSGVAGGRTVLLPDAAALPGKLALERALRPLRRRVPAPHRVEVDEIATARYAATLRLAWRTAPLFPVFRASRARWLDTVLLVDRSQSMAVWRRVIEEWEVLLQRLGAFRNLRVWHLLPGSDGGGPKLISPTGEDANPWMRRDAAELSGMCGRRLVLIATDCIGPLWQSAATSAWLGRQGRSGPLAILQILPAHLWRRTALGRNKQFLVRSTAAGAPSHRLVAEPLDPDLLDEEDAAPEVCPIPVIPLEAGPLHDWARMLVGHPAGAASGFHFDVPVSPGPAQRRPETPATDRTDAFLRASSDVARNLAAYLAAVPLTMPVIRRLQQELVPDARPEHLSEVLFSGLLVQRVPDLWKAASDEELYDFHPGVRERLLSLLSVTTIESIARRIGASLAINRGSDHNFAAVLFESTDPLAPAAVGRPFASVSAALRAVARAPARKAVQEHPDASRQPETETTAPSPGPDRPENGFWILVDGADQFEIPLHQLALARSLGTELARNGFSLVTLGTRGVAHVVARAFWEVLHRQEHSSGIYRILHIVADGQADFPKGRTILELGEPVASAAASRADALWFIGKSSRSRELMEAARLRSLPMGGLEDADLVPKDLRFVSPAGPDSVHSSWDVIRALNERLAVPTGRGTPAFDRLAGLAARALDEQDLDDYNKVLRTIERELAARDLSEEIPRLLRDPRRPSHRLLGYLASERHAPELLVAALISEQRTIRQLRETRTLWLALDGLRSVMRSTSSTYGRALAAACVCIANDLQHNPHIDPGGECKEYLASIRRQLPFIDHAERLLGYADRYHEIRNTNEVGRSQTQEMSRLVRTIQREPSATLTTPEAEVWFSSGHPGHRIVALALLRGSSAREPGGFSLVERAISHSDSPFEQFTALRVAERLLYSLGPHQRAQLRHALERQRSGPPGIIDRTDSTRWDLSGALLAQLGPLPPGDRAASSSDPILEPASAVIVGIGRYPGIKHLAGATNDARAMAEAVQRLGYPSARIRVLLDEEASPYRVLEAIRESTERSPTGRLLVFFSGHAAFHHESGLTLLTFMSSFEDPTAAGISTRELLERAVPREWHLTLVLDCDCAGGALGGKASAVSVGTGARIVLAGCGRHELAREASVRGSSHGAFTAVLLEGLARAEPLERAFTAVSLFQHVQDDWKRKHRRQTPELLLLVGPDMVLTGSDGADSPRTPPQWPLPESARPLMGRAERVAAVTTALTTNKLVAIVGARGVGKSALALQVAHDLRAQNTFSPIIWVSVSPGMSLGDLVDRFSVALDYPFAPQAPMHARAELLLRELSSPGADAGRLIVVDGFDAIGDAAAADFVTRLLPTSSTVLLTSAGALPANGAKAAIVALDELAEGDTLALVRFLQRQLGLRVSPDVEGVRIHRVTGGNPLAIELVVGRMVESGALDLVLGDLERGAAGIFDLHKAIWVGLPERGRALMRAIAFFPAEISENLLLVASGLRAPEFHDEVRDLVDRYLIQRSNRTDDPEAERQYRIHPFSREIIRDEPSDQEGLAETCRRTARYFIGLVRDRYGSPEKESAPALKSLSQDTENVAAVIDGCNRYGLLAEFVELVDASVRWLFVVGLWDRLVGWLMRAIEAAKETSNPTSAARLHAELGRIYAYRSEFGQAEDSLNRALELATGAGNPAVLAYANHHFGEMRMREKRLLDAEPYLRRSLELFTTLGAARDIIGVRFRLATLAFEIGDLTRARELLTRGLEDCINERWERLEGYHRNYLGEVALMQSDPTEAREQLSRALALVSTNDARRVALIELTLARLDLTMQDRTSATSRAARAMEGFSRLRMAKEMKMAATILAGDDGSDRDGLR
jgi:tetratricopeptide (TPR) repeat protein